MYQSVLSPWLPLHLTTTSKNSLQIVQKGRGRGDIVPETLNFYLSCPWAFCKILDFCQPFYSVSATHSSCLDARATSRHIFAVPVVCFPTSECLYLFLGTDGIACHGQRRYVCNIPSIRCWQVTTAGLSCVALHTRTDMGSLNWMAKIFARPLHTRLGKDRKRKIKPLPPAFSFERIMISNAIFMSQGKTSFWIKFEKVAFFQGAFFFPFP